MDNYTPELSSRATARATGNLAQFDRGLDELELYRQPRGSDVYVPTNRFEQSLSGRNMDVSKLDSGFEGLEAGSMPAREALNPVKTVDLGYDNLFRWIHRYN